MSEQVFIQVRFQEETEFGEYNDALYFTQAEYSSKQKSEINSLKQARVDGYVDAVRNAPTAKEPTKQELIDEKEKLLIQVADLDVKIAGAK